MQAPENGSELQQFVCAANWMRTAIPEFTKVIMPFYETLEKVHSIAANRTKSVVSEIRLDEEQWGSTQISDFNTLKTALHSSAELTHTDPKKSLYVFTDASDTHWSGVLTQVPASYIDLPFPEQRHEPIVFLSESFKGSSGRVSTAEQEAFAIVGLDYLLLRPEGFHIFTDNRNLVYIYIILCL